VSAWLYGARLDYVPAHLGWDEVFFGLNGHALASTGRDINGSFLPLYFHMGEGNIWYQPALAYATALVFTLLPMTEATLRIPSVLVALVDIVLMYFVARRILKSDGLGFVAAGLLAMTPPHLLLGRVALDYIFPLPFILIWLLCLAAFVDRPRPWLIAAATASLGIGFFSYMASVVMMPFYFMTTVLFVTVSDARPKWRYYLAALTFFLPLLVLVPWLRAHPSAYAQQVARYRVYDVQRFTPLQGIKEFLNYQNLTHRVSMYWGYIGPNYLFMSGAIKMSMTTRKVGVFLLACGVFLPVGIYQMLTKRRDWLGRLLIFGFATAPLAALLVDDPFAVDREMNLLPFGVLLTAFGVGCLLQSPRLRVRILAVCLLVLVPVEFSYFYRDYFGDYRLASAEWFNRNIRGGLEDVIAREDRNRPIPVYLSIDIGNIDQYWQFYLIKHDRADLQPRTVYFDSKSIALATIPSGGLVVCPTEDVWQQEQVKLGELQLLNVIREPDGKPSFVVLARR
jgi:4-amino-4-deoxy-L-arabinose transferase-like glycosyltransferase